MASAHRYIHIRQTGKYLLANFENGFHFRVVMEMDIGAGLATYIVKFVSDDVTGDFGERRNLYFFLEIHDQSADEIVYLLKSGMLEVFHEVAGIHVVHLHIDTVLAAVYFMHLRYANMLVLGE